MKMVTLRPMSRRTAAILLGLTALLTVTLTIAAWYVHDRDARTQSASTASVSAAEASARALFSYDYRSFDASVANGATFATGDFAREYAQTTTALKPAAVKEQAVVRAEVSAAGVVTATPDEVVVLVYVDQYRRNVNITGEKVDQNRVVLTMVRADGEWRVKQAQAI